MANSGKSLDLSLVFLAVCVFGLPGEATAASHTSTYIFVPEQSQVVQTGGIAYVHWTYSIRGHFQLTVDPNAGTASFAHVDANATDDGPFKRTLEPNHVFNMTSLVGTVEPTGSIKFTGKAPDDSDVSITVTLQDSLAHLIGQTTPPPNSADFFIFSLDAVAQLCKYGGGSGKPNDPYLIYTAEQMNAIGIEPNDWDKHFKLMADVDLGCYTATEFNTIGTGYFEFDPFDPILITKPFSGSFDGNNHCILNFNYHDSVNLRVWFVGIFGIVDGKDAKIKNLAIVDPNIDVTYGDAVAPLVGYVACGTVSNCLAAGVCIHGSHRVAGLIAVTGDETLISGCHSHGSIRGHAFVGGLIGENYGTISNCTSSASVRGSGLFLGGLSGANYYGRILNCCSRSIVSGTNWLGGLVGENRGLIYNCYTAGSLTGAGENVGALIGYNSGAVMGSFWDAQTSGQAHMCGNQHVKGTGCNDANGKTTAEMQTASTFLEAGWDFVNIWGIGENQTYPYLRKYSAADINQDASVNFLDLAVLAENWLAEGQ